LVICQLTVAGTFHLVNFDQSFNCLQNGGKILILYDYYKVSFTCDTDERVILLQSSAFETHQGEASTANVYFTYKFIELKWPNLAACSTLLGSGQACHFIKHRTR